MMNKAREFYHAPDFEEKYRRGRMILWTVIDGKVYKEYPPYVTEDMKGELMEEKYWPSSIHKAARHPNFPKKVQFWTRSQCDLLDKEDLAIR